MRTITAKFTSKCAKCNNTLKKGTEIQYDPSERKAYCKDCKPRTDEDRESESIAAYIDAQECAMFERY